MTDRFVARYRRLLALMPAPARAKWTESWTLDLTRAESIRYSPRNVAILDSGAMCEDKWF